ncbi:MAG: hypothetical protein WDO72_03535 [Pseudomonadota bacterium]
MNRKLEIEARLDRALATQIAAPKIDGRFDAAVWSRIEAEEAAATNPAGASVEPGRARIANLSRWMFVSNAVGTTVALILAIYFGLRAFGGVNPGLKFEMPALSQEFLMQAMTGVGYVLTFVVLTFAVALTSFGRRLRAQFS